VFSGKMSYHANITAALQLLQGIMPRVWNVQPDARLLIVGKSPSRAILDLAHRHGGRVTVTGFVPDIRPYLCRATIAVAPISYGAGIQNKVLEAMACGTPVVASPRGASGLDARAGVELLVAEGARSQARDILRLLAQPDRQRWQRAAKTVLDYGVAIPALILMSPLLAVIAAYVKLDSPGPVLYRRRVLGRGGQAFDAFKIRTMRVDGDAMLAGCPDLLAELEETHKIKDDPRVTRVGRWLRAYSLDELTQLINVLRGEMSLVGPRMISPAERERYGPEDRVVLSVRPGLTGLWQVSGRADLPYSERVRMDVRYVEDFSIRRDLEILFLRTLPAVVRRRGAY
jgi:lipopolysaccharide/colanic/teichoic acid biosynthesis glycosyltransferase